jgi:hypothetical protein
MGAVEWRKCVALFLVCHEVFAMNQARKLHSLLRNEPARLGSLLFVSGLPAPLGDRSFGVFS